MKYRIIKEIPLSEKCWEDHDVIPVGTICSVGYFEGFDTICYDNKFICDTDSEMAQEYFEKIM